jgi:polysaccharide pyruvyl transferase WcaK-like protein
MAKTIKKDITILCGDADGNLGDRAILRSMCLAFRDGIKDGRIRVALSGQRLHDNDLDILVLPKGLGGLAKLCVAAVRSKAVICGGGGLFQDDDSLIKMPYWGLRIVLMRLFCPCIIGYSLGVGPLRAWSSKAFARLAFVVMDRISVRDPRAFATAQPLTGKTVQLLPDPALLLPPASRETARQWLQDNGVDLGSQLLIGFTARRWFSSRYRLIPNRITSRLRRDNIAGTPEGTRFISLLAEALDEVARKHNAQVLFLPTYNVPHEGDDRLCEQIGKEMSWKHTVVLRTDDPGLYKGIVRELAVMVAGRMHPAIFAASVGTPFVALAYNQKFHGFCELVDYEKRLLDVDTFIKNASADELCVMMEAAIQDRSTRVYERCGQFAEEIRRFNRDMLEDLL